MCEDEKNWGTIYNMLFSKEQALEQKLDAYYNKPNKTTEDSDFHDLLSDIGVMVIELEELQNTIGESETTNKRNLK